MITGEAAGVPYVALPPAADPGWPAPLIVGWHLNDPPRSAAAMPAALPLNEVTAWRVYLDLAMHGRRGTDVAGYRAMLAFAKGSLQRTWVIEGCVGIGKHIAQRLIADGEQVVDVSPKLSARMRVFATGRGRKTDATDAHSVALVGTRRTGLRPVIDDEQLAILRILVDCRRALGEDHTRMVSQLHHLLLELIPGGAMKDLSAAQAKALLAKVRPCDAAGPYHGTRAVPLVISTSRRLIPSEPTLR